MPPLMSRHLSKNNIPEVVLTGGIGAGKSVVAKFFRVLGIPVFDADTEAKHILAHDSNLRLDIISHFGDEAYDGSMPNRPFLAKRIFENADLRSKLNSLVHPAVGRFFQEWKMQNQAAPYIVKEAAIAMETGSHLSADCVILVTAPEGIRIQRVMERNNISRKDVMQRMAAQWTDEQKLALANFVITNDDLTAVIPQTLHIHNAVSRKEYRQ